MRRNESRLTEPPERAASAREADGAATGSRQVSKTEDNFYPARWFGKISKDQISAEMLRQAARPRKAGDTARVRSRKSNAANQNSWNLYSYGDVCSCWPHLMPRDKA